MTFEREICGSRFEVDFVANDDPQTVRVQVEGREILEGTITDLERLAEALSEAAKLIRASPEFSGKRAGKAKKVSDE